MDAIFPKTDWGEDGFCLGMSYEHKLFGMGYCVSKKRSSVIGSACSSGGWVAMPLKLLVS